MPNYGCVTLQLVSVPLGPVAWFAAKSGQPAGWLALHHQPGAVSFCPEVTAARSYHWRDPGASSGLHGWCGLWMPWRSPWLIFCLWHQRCVWRWGWIPRWRPTNAINSGFGLGEAVEGISYSFYAHILYSLFIFINFILIFYTFFCCIFLLLLLLFLYFISS